MTKVQIEIPEDHFLEFLRLYINDNLTDILTDYPGLDGLDITTATEAELVTLRRIIENKEVLRIKDADNLTYIITFETTLDTL